MNHRAVVLTSQVIVPPMGGGALRTYYLTRALTLSRAVSVINSTRQREKVVHSSDCKVDSWDISGFEFVFPEKRRWSKDIINHGEQWLVWSADPLNRRYCPRKGYRKALLHLLGNDSSIDLVVINHTWMLRTISGLRRRFPKVRFVLDAHNVESVNTRQLIHGNKIDLSPIHRAREVMFLKAITALESSLARYVDLVWACSPEDVAWFQSHNPDTPCALIPNGVDTHRVSYYNGPERWKRQTLITVSSLGYSPNAVGVLWFYERVWSGLKARYPDLKWYIVGKNPPPEILDLASDHITVTGRVPDPLPYLHKASISVCPILTGSGTRLKVLEAMSSGNPVVSTTAGAAGIKAKHGIHLYLADNPETFAQAVSLLLDDGSAHEAIRQRAREFVEMNYDWDMIGRKAVRSTDEIISI